MCSASGLPRQPDTLSLQVKVPKTGLWRAQWSFTVFLYVLSGILIVLPIIFTVMGADRLYGEQLGRLFEKSIGSRWIGENWSWFRIVLISAGSAVLVLMHLPRPGLLLLQDRLLTVKRGRKFHVLNVDRAKVAWERWPGSPETAPRMIVTITDGSTQLRLGILDVQAPQGLPLAKARHAVPDLILEEEQFWKLDGRLLRLKAGLSPLSHTHERNGNEGSSTLFPAGANAAPEGKSTSWLGRFNFPFGRLALCLLLSLIALLLTATGVLSEQYLPLFSLPILAVWLLPAFLRK